MVCIGGIWELTTREISKEKVMLKQINKISLAISVIAGFNLVTLSAQAKSMGDIAYDFCHSEWLSFLLTGLGLWCIAFAIYFFASAIFVLFMKKRAVAGKLLGGAVTYLCFGVFIVLFVFSHNVFDSGMNLDSNDVVSIIQLGILATVLAIILCFALVAYFLPAIVAFNKQKRVRKMILAANFIVPLIPFAWITLLMVSLADDKKTIDKQDERLSSLARV